MLELKIAEMRMQADEMGGLEKGNETKGLKSTNYMSTQRTQDEERLRPTFDRILSGSLYK
jgi:hypothetical protein